MPNNSLDTKTETKNETKTKSRVIILPSRRSVADIVASTLEQIPTHLGRLVYLARCRERDGRYTHHGLGLDHNAEAIHRALLKAHERYFREWLNLGLAEQHADLSAYLDGLNVKRVLKAWSDSEPWHAIAAPSADEAERRLFASDFRRLLELLQR
jgi:hypothetical protein